MLHLQLPGQGFPQRGGSSPPPQAKGSFDYANDWVNPSQTYYKLLVTRDGVYRVSLADLQLAGVNTAGLLPQNLHLTRRGEEQPMHVQDSAGTLQWFEFFGRRNDGREDSLLYRDSYTHLFVPDQVTNVHRSLFTDTATYFLWWDNNPGLRFTEAADTNYAAYTPEPWFRTRLYTDFVAPPYKQGGANPEEAFSALNCDYVPGEGFSGLGFDPGGNNLLITGTVQHAGTGNPNRLTARLFSYSSAPDHVRRIRVNGNPIFTDTVPANDIRTITAFDNLVFFQPFITLTFEEVPTSTNAVKESKVSWITVDYDRLFDLSGSCEINLREWTSASAAYFRFTNTSPSPDAVLYDLSTDTRITGSAPAGEARFIVPGAAAAQRELYFAADTCIRKPLIVPFTRLVNLSDVSRSAEFVIITHRSFAASAQNYETYRETQAPNPLNTLVVYTDEIYDEFGYGEVTPQAIQRFCKFALHEWQSPPRYFLLWGRARGNHRFVTDDYVPTWGLPAADVYYVSNWYPNVLSHTPEAAIGRVNIISNAVGQAYLDKVIEYETMAQQPWMKNALLLSGGGTSDNAVSHAMIVSDSTIATPPYRERMEAPPFSGNVYWLMKSGNNTITNSGLTNTQIINQGISLLHFFGHSSQSSTELELYDPSLYQNAGRYPFMIAFGCNSGDFTNADASFGETHVAYPNGGSIGLLANTSFGMVDFLKPFGNEFYQVQFDTHYGRPIGEVLQETQRRYLLNVLDAEAFRINHGRQMVLQCDPALTVRYPQLPDLSISSNDLYLTPGSFSAQDNQFTINVRAHNTGSMPADSFRISVRHFTPAGTTIDYPAQWVPAFNLTDTFSLTFLNTLGPAMAGLNEFEVTLDSGNVIAEYDESNNVAILRLTVAGVSPAVLFPPEFAIVPSNTVTLAASAYIMSTQNPVDYIYEIDTNPDFHSPLHQASGVVSGTSVYSEWAVPGTLVDSGVYYWRVRIATVWPPVWTTSSFRYINGVTGWSQAQPVQFFKDPTSQVEMDELNRVWKFLMRNEELHAWIEPNGLPHYSLSTFQANLQGGPPGVKYTPISQRTLEPSIQNTLYEDWALMTSPDGESDLITKIQLTPVGDWFLLVSNYDPGSQFWSPQLNAAMSLIGVNQAERAALAAGTQFIILGRKGFANSAIVILDPNVQVSNQATIFDLRRLLSAPYREGEVASPLIGPAVSWNSVKLDWSTLEPLGGDSVEMEVWGVRSDNTDSLLLSGLAEGVHSLVWVDADRFPYLRLGASLRDEPYGTSPQLDEWSVLFAQPPDAAVDPTVNYAFARDTVAEGEVVSIALSARNLTPVPMDSLLISFTVERSDRTRLIMDSLRIAPLNGNALLPFNYAFNTAQKNLRGDVTLIVEINPGMEQPEMHAFNNLFYQRFYVIHDAVNPLLEVTFDGKHLIEGDLVSPDPEIRVQLNDENPWLPIVISDTTVEIWFGQGRTQSQLNRIFIDGNSQVEPLHASMRENKAGVIFRPGTLADGEYTLRVNGKDFSGNAAGPGFYEIHFNVVSAKTMSEVVNYPNPFSSSTRFVYTLTGSELPRRFEVRIFTISGRLVKVIDLLDAGDVHLGYNVTATAWDGTDEFGDKLANGVYIYQVVTDFENGNPELRDEGISQYFKNGFGKMVLMR